jgi:hypothetical protein
MKIQKIYDLYEINVNRKELDSLLMLIKLGQEHLNGEGYRLTDSAINILQKFKEIGI